MAKRPQNRLKIRVLPSGAYQLYGYTLGKRVRMRAREIAPLKEVQAKHEMEVADAEKTLANMPQLRMTRLTDAQLQDAEAAVEMAQGRRLVECVAAGLRILPANGQIGCADALAEWLEAMTTRKRSDRTADKNRLRVEAFIGWAQVDTVAKILPGQIEKWVYRAGPSDFTRLTDAQVLRAWLNFCVSRRWLAVSPFEIDMKDLSATARPEEEGRILTPDQCARLLGAALEHKDGLLAPYVILTTWCFMRDSEARMVQRAHLRLDVDVPVVEVAGKKRRTAKYRTVSIPSNVLPILRRLVKNWEPGQLVPFSRHGWAIVRERAGLMQRGKTTRGKRRPIVSSRWQPDITRHTGISYLYQRTGDIKEVCRQAGNTSDVSFRHYLTMPEPGACDQFYGRISAPDSQGKLAQSPRRARGQSASN